MGKIRATRRDVGTAAAVMAGGVLFYALLALTQFPGLLPGYPAVLVAFGLWFIVPGWLVQRAILADGRATIIEQASVALLASVALAAGPGLVALKLHWSIGAFALSYAALASVANGLAVFIIRREPCEPQNEAPAEPKRPSRIPLLVLIGIPLLAIATSPWWAENRVSRDFDDWVYMAYVTEYLGSDELDASAPFANTRPGQFGRMQYNVWVAGETLVADSASVAPSDLILDYLPPLMTLLVVAAAFTLARGLFGSTSVALLAAAFVLLYGALDLTAHEGYGRSVFLRIGEDKMVSSFIMLPIGLLLCTRYLLSPSPRTYLGPLLAIPALFATHPMGLILLGVALAPLCAIRLATERTFGSIRSAASVLLPWLFLMFAFDRWTEDSQRVTLINAPFRRAFHMIDVTDDLVIGSYHMFLHPMVIATVLLAVPLWLIGRRHIGRQLLLAMVAGVLLVTFVPQLATELSSQLNDEAVYRLQWLLPVPVLLAFATHQFIHWLSEHAAWTRRAAVAAMLPVTAVLLIGGAAAFALEYYTILDDGAFYDRTSASTYLPGTDGSIVAGGIDKALAGGSRPSREQEEVLDYMKDSLEPGSLVLMERAGSDFVYGWMYRVRPIAYRGGPNYPQRRQLVLRFDDGALSQTELSEAVQTFALDLVVVQSGSPADRALKPSVRYRAEDLVPVDGAPELEEHQRLDRAYTAWSFDAVNRERVGGEFTVPPDINPNDSTLDIEIDIAPSTSLTADRTARIVVSLWKKDEPDAEVTNVVFDKVLRAGLGEGTIVSQLKLPTVAFEPGATYAFTVWRSPDAEEDSYPDDIWFVGLDIEYSTADQRYIADTPYYAYDAAALVAAE